MKLTIGLCTGHVWSFRPGRSMSHVWSLPSSYVPAMYGAYMELDFDGGVDDMKAGYPVDYQTS